MNIRNFNNRDLGDLLQLIQLHTPHYFAPEETSDFEYYLRYETEHYFVVEVNQQIVGCGGINFENTFTTAKISWDLIHPDYQGKGYGRLLLEHRLEVARSMPTVKRIIVRTSQYAFQFYKKSGFVLQDIHPNYWAQGYDLYVMELKL